MKIILTIVLTLISTTCILSQSYTDKKGNTHLWGEVNVDQFRDAPYAEWYEKNRQDFDSKLTPEDKAIYKDLKVKIFIGTWCGDTKYLFPKFIKTWESMGLEEDQLEIIALHHEGDLYKQGPNQETKDLDIHRVPTFVFYNHDKEIGRIVERTFFDLETDMDLIGRGSLYKHHYQAVPMVSQLMNEFPDSLSSEFFLENTADKVYRETSGMGELNTYAYTLFFAGELDKATFVFSLNKELHPYNPAARYGYGKALYTQESYDLAKVEFSEAIRIKPDFKKAIEYLYKINENIEKLDD